MAVNNNSNKLRLPNVGSDGSECRIATMTENILVFRSQMKLYSGRSDTIFGFNTKSWQLPRVKKLKAPRTPEVSSDWIPLLQRKNGGLYSFTDAFETVTDPTEPNKPPEQRLPWPPLASAQLVT